MKMDRTLLLAHPKYIFDVDGTLTPSRGEIDKKFAVWFSKFCESHECYLVTGSDKPKTLEQVGPVIYNRAKNVYQCGGNEKWQGDTLLHTNDIELSYQLKKDLCSALEESKFKHKTGKGHIEIRSGLINFSILGRPASSMTRDLYVKHDQFTNERQTICQDLSWDHDKYQFSVAGETGIDITYQGMTKAQILNNFSDADKIYFFGDKTGFGGNDHEIANAVIDRGKNNKAFTIDGWQHTWNILKQLG